jgi:hypothetical protein
MMPKKVLRHFPIIPRLKQMFKTPTLAGLMCWHHANKSTDGLVCHAIDSKAWAHIDSMWPDFAKDPLVSNLGLP